MKPKMDWVLRKTEMIKGSHPRRLPDTLNVTLTAVYNFIRTQRNELGHPQDRPPVVTREEAFVNLRVFPTYYIAADRYISFLGASGGV